MNFKTVQEAFNFYRNNTKEQLIKRAQELKAIIETDPEVDIKSMNIELTAINEAMENNQEKDPENADPEARNKAFNLIERMANQGAKIDPENAVNSKEYRTAFFKTLLNKPLNQEEKRAFNSVVEKRAFNASSDSVAVLPTNTLNEVIAKARTEGGLLAEVRAFNMPVKIAIPIGTPGNKATWHTEGEAVESETTTTASVIFDGYEIIKIISISKKVEKMSVDAFEAYLVEELTACVMECIADAIINGTGTNQGLGLEKGITWNAKNSKAVTVAPDYKDLCGFVAMLKRGYSKGAKFAMNNATLYTWLYALTDDNANPILIKDPKADTVGKLLGFEIVVDDNIADNTIYFGNFSKYYGFNLADSITLEKSTQSSFKNNLIDFKATAIADCKPLVEEAFIKMTITA